MRLKSFEYLQEQTFSKGMKTFSLVDFNGAVSVDWTDLPTLLKKGEDKELFKCMSTQFYNNSKYKNVKRMPYDFFQ